MSSESLTEPTPTPTRNDLRAKHRLAPLPSFLATRLDDSYDFDDNPTLPWLWKDILPANHVTLLAGPAGIGKSLLAIDIAARVSRGSRFPFLPSNVDEYGKASKPKPRNVIIFTNEDSAEGMLGARLAAAGADPTHIFIIDSTQMDESTTPEEVADLQGEKITEAVEALCGQAHDLDAALIIIDPLAALFGNSANRASHIRPALETLAEHARHFNCAILALAHTAPHRAGQYRLLGPAILSNIPRTIWHIDTMPDEETRVLLPAKSNYAKPPALTFTLDAKGLHWKDLRPDLARHPSLKLADRPALDTAQDFLKDALADGPPAPTEPKAAPTPAEPERSYPQRGQGCKGFVVIRVSTQCTANPRAGGNIPVPPNVRSRRDSNATHR